MRSTLVDYFREQGQIMIATEVGVEDYLIVAALADNGQSLDVEQATRLLQLPAMDCRHLKTSLMSEPLASLIMCHQEAILRLVSQRNAAFFEAEANKLDGGPRI